MNTFDMQAAACAAMRDAGMEPLDAADVRTDGTLCRFACVGESPLKRNAWCVVFPTGPRPVACFGHWSRDIKATKALGDGSPMTDIEREQARMAAAFAQRERQREKVRAQAEARNTADRIWSRAQREPEFHPYLQRKGVGSNGARLDGMRLVIAYRDERGALTSLQFIAPTGNKKFLRGGRIVGCHGTIGTMGGPRILIAEGFATAASVHEGCGLPVAIAGHAGNILPVAETLHAKFPAARITIAGDNDDRGRDAAQEAAQAVGGDVILPPAEGADWNDWCTANGADALLEALA